MSARTTKLVCWLQVAAATACAMAKAEPSAEQPLEYRRFFVPAERPQDWPKRNVRYLPVEREEFERLLEAANSRPPSNRLASPARIVRATYQAELADDSLNGQARLEVNHAGTHPVLMPVEPLALAIAGGRWERNGPAIMGFADSGKTAVIVGNSDALLLDWSLRGKRDLGGTLVFDLDLPPSAVCQLDMKLPDSIVPVLDEGIVAGNAADQKRGRWRFELGGRTHAVLKLQASESYSRQRRLALLQERTTYRFSLGGMDIQSQLKLDVYREPIHRLQLDLESQLRIVSVQQGGNELSWTIDPSQANGKQTLTIDFAEPLIGTGKVITLTALAPVVIDKPLRLPRWRARDVIWQEGDATLLLPPPLTLDALLPVGCRQTKATPPGGSAVAGESVDLQLFSPEATADVQMSRRRQQMIVTSGSTIRFASDRIRAELRGTFEFVEGQAFLLQAQVGPGWQIDAVTADRSGTLAGWSIDRTTRPASLVVQLAEPLRPSQPLMLLVTGHRSVSADHRFSATALEMLSFRDCLERRRLLALETSGSHRVWLDGDDRPALIDRSTLVEIERALLASALGDTILALDPDRTDWSVFIEPQSPHYSVDLRVNADCSTDRLSESYSIRCQPEASRVDRLLIAFSQTREQPVDFRLAGDSTPLSSERLSSAEQSARGLASAGEVWLVHLPQAIDGPFELRATRNVPFADGIAAALISVPEADSQQAAIEITATREPPLIRHADRLEPIPLKVPPADRYSDLRAAFHYDPIKELGGELAEAVVLSRESPSAGQAMIWRLRLHTHYLLSGGCRNLAVFDVENQGRPRCSIRLPAGAELLHVAVDGTAVAAQKDDGGFDVPLPTDRRFPMISLEYSLAGASLGIITSFRPPWPSADAAVAAREWSVSVNGPFLTWTDSSAPWSAPWPLRSFTAEGDEQRPFDPIRASQWRQLITESSADGHSPLAARFLEALGKKLASGQPADTWGRLLTEVIEDEKTWAPRLFIDLQSLSQLDVGPSTPLDLSFLPGDRERITSRTAQLLAAQLLRNYGLTLTADENRIVLTARWMVSEAGHERGATAPERSFSNAVPAGRPQADGRRYVSALAWKGEPETTWDRNYPASAFADLAVDARIVDCPMDAPSVWLIRRDVVVASVVGIGMVFSALTSKLSRGHHSIVVLLAGLAAAAAIWSPPPLAAIPWGAVAGCLAGIVWRWIRPIAPERGAVVRNHSTALVAGAGTALVAIFLSMSALHAQETASPAETSVQPADNRPEIHNVILPVDARGKPSGLYYLPLDFLDKLRRRASATLDEPRGWLLTGGAYECSLVRENAEELIGISDLRVHYDLHVISADAHVRLQFDRRQVELVADSAELDGQPIDLAWDENGTALFCDVADPGDYILEFKLGPMLNDGPDWRDFDLRVPPLASSTVSVVLPTDAVNVELPTSLGEVHLDREGRRLRANLGLTDRLTLRWPRQSAAQAQVEVEELLWLKIRPGSVVLDVDLNFQIDGGVLRQVEFAADRRLRLMPGGALGKEKTLPLDASAPDGLQLTQIELERPVADRLRTRLSFLLSGASGVGNARLPVFHTQNAHITRRWLAVTIDSPLEYEKHDVERLDPLPVADFAAAWHDADPAALRDALAFRLDGDDLSWSLATRSREPQTTAKETLALSFERSSALLRYNAQITTVGGFVFQHRLRVPADLQIKSVTFEEEETERPVRWARSDEQNLTVFLSRRASGSQQLTLTGRLPVRANGRLLLPSVSFETAEPLSTERIQVAARTIQLYRQPEVQIALENVEGIDERLAPIAEPAHTDLGRLVFSGATEASYSGTVVVKPNQPRITDATQFTVLRYVNQAWIAEIDYRFDVQRGIVDKVAFDVPANWGANLEVVAPPSTIDLADQPGKTRKVLTLRPLKPLSGPCQIRIRSPLKTAPGEPVAAPDAVPLAGAGTERYWCLPQQVGIESVSWDVERMAPAMLPEGAQPPYADAESFAVFRSIGDHPQAVMGSTKAAVGAARARLSDVCLAMDGDFWKGIAAFDIEPGGDANCQLRLAPGWRLTAATVNSFAVAPLPSGEGAWQIPLSSNRLPQRVELLVETTKARPRSTVKLSLPVASLDGLPVEESLLSVHAPRGWQLELNAERVDVAARNAARIASVMSLVDLPDEVVGTTSRDDLRTWFGPWARWLRWCNRQAKGTTVSSIDKADGGSVAAESWLRIARRLHIGDAPTASFEQPLVGAQPMEIWADLYRFSPVELFHWSGTNGPQELVIKKGFSEGWQTRGMLTTWLMLAVTAALILPRFAAVTDLPRRWPCLTLAAMGLVWWLFCQPSAAGWSLIAAALVAAVCSAIRPLPVFLSRT